MKSFFLIYGCCLLLLSCGRAQGRLPVLIPHEETGTLKKVYLPQEDYQKAIATTLENAIERRNQLPQSYDLVLDTITIGVAFDLRASMGVFHLSAGKTIEFHLEVEKR